MIKITPPKQLPVEAETATIGQRIRTARKALNLNQESLAARLSVTQPTVANWEADVHNPRQLMLAKLAEALNVSLGWLAGGEGESGQSTRNPSTGYLSRGIYHVPVLPAHLLTAHERLADGSLDGMAVDYIPLTAYTKKMFATFVESGVYSDTFPGETLFVFDYSRTAPTQGVFGLVTAEGGPMLQYWADDTDLSPMPLPVGGTGEVLGLLSISIRFF